MGSGTHTKKNLHLLKSSCYLVHPPLCGDSHSFCEKSSSPSSIRDSPLGSMKIIESLQQIWKPKIRNPTIQIQTSLFRNCSKTSLNPSLKLNYSSSAFSRALLHNKKVRTRYFGDETSQIPSTPCPGAWEGLDGIFWPTLKHFVPNN